MTTPTGLKSQAEKFIEAARATSSDESEPTFLEKLAVIARQKPKDEPVKAKKQPT